MSHRALKYCLALVLMTVISVSPVEPQAVRTDLNLVIAIDCSYSVNAREFNLQSVGIAKALRSPEIMEAIESGRYSRIALSVIQWSGPDIQEIVVPWTLVATASDAFRLAERVESSERLTAEGVTAIGSAIAFATKYHDRAPYWAERRVIDMQADGTNTWSRGVPIRKARDFAVNHGIIVNGLPIMNEVPYLHHYFRNNVIGGPGSFIEIAENYRSFEEAIKRKLLREIRGVPVV